MKNCEMLFVEGGYTPPVTVGTRLMIHYCTPRCAILGPLKTPEAGASFGYPSITDRSEMYHPQSFQIVSIQHSEYLI